MDAQKLTASAKKLCCNHAQPGIFTYSVLQGTQPKGSPAFITAAFHPTGQKQDAGIDKRLFAF
jgi:hypothetical protein